MGTRFETHLHSIITPLKRGSVFGAIFICWYGCNNGSTESKPDPVNRALTVDVQGPSMLEVPAEATYSFSAKDNDGLTDVGMISITAPDGSIERIDWPYSGVSADTSITRTFSEEGVGKAELTAFGNNPVTGGRDVKSAVQSTQYAVALEERAIEITAHNDVLNIPITGQVVELYKDGNLLQTASFVDGLARFDFENEQGVRSEYQAKILAHGYTDTTLSVVSDESLESRALSLSPASISLGSISEMNPRSEKIVDVTSLYSSVDPETGESVSLEQAVLSSKDNRLVITDQENNLYKLSFAPGTDPADVSLPVVVGVTSKTNVLEQETSVSVDQREPLSYTQTHFSGKENSTLSLYDVAQYIASAVALDSVNVSSSHPSVSITRTGSDDFAITPEHGFSGNVNLNLYASNIEGSVEQVVGSVDFERLPRFSATVHDNVTDDVVSNAYLVFEELENDVFVPKDTLFAENGRFSDVILSSEYARFGQRKDEKNFAYEHRIKPSADGSYEVVIAPFVKRDASGNAIGIWTRDEMQRRHNDMERSWTKSSYGRVNEGETGIFDDQLPVFNTENGQPNKVILVVKLETQYYDTNNNLVIERDSMSARDVAFIQDWYQNETRQINAVGNPKITRPPELTVEQNYVLKIYDREDGNAYILPRSGFNDRAAIAISSTGIGKIYDAFISLRSASNNDPSQSSQYAAFTQESVALFGEHGTLPAQQLTTLESMVNNAVNTDDAQWFPLNRFASWITNHTGYQSLPNEGKFSNAVILPEDN